MSSGGVRQTKNAPKTGRFQWLGLWHGYKDVSLDHTLAAQQRAMVLAAQNRLYVSLARGKNTQFNNRMIGGRDLLPIDDDMRMAQRHGLCFGQAKRGKAKIRRRDRYEPFAVFGWHGGQLYVRGWRFVWQLKKDRPWRPAPRIDLGDEQRKGRQAKRHGKRRCEAIERHAVAPQITCARAGRCGNIRPVIASNSIAP